MYAVFDYGNTIIQRSIRELKYYRHSEATKALCLSGLPYIVEHISDQLQSHHSHQLIFVPVPTHHKRVQERGFNQSLLIAQWWSSALSASCVLPCLKKTTQTLPQATLNRKFRLQNVKNSMICTKTLNHKNIYVIVDDVITTGATCDEAHRALYTAGARKIHIVALAHGYARK